MSIRIVALNCWGGCLLPPLLDFLPQIHADVYCLSEIRSMRAEFNPEGKADVEGGQFDLFEKITHILPDTYGYFCPAMEWFVNDGTFTEIPTRYGIATFVRKHLAVTAQRSGFVHGAFHATKTVVRPAPRQAHVVRVYDPASNEEVVVAHMHGLWVSSGKEDNVHRIGQASRLRTLVNSMCVPKDEKVVICGDFNVLPESDTFKIFAQDGFQELVTKNKITDTRTSHYTKTPRNADYMLVSRQVHVESFSVVRAPEVSDHCPLVLDCS